MTAATLRQRPASLGHRPKSPELQAGLGRAAAQKGVREALQKRYSLTDRLARFAVSSEQSDRRATRHAWVCWSPRVRSPILGS